MKLFKNKPDYRKIAYGIGSAVCFICIIGFVLPFVLIYIGFKLGNFIDNSFSYDEPKKIEDPLFEDD